MMRNALILKMRDWYLEAPDWNRDPIVVCATMKTKTVVNFLASLCGECFIIITLDTVVLCVQHRIATYLTVAKV